VFRLLARGLGRRALLSEDKGKAGLVYNPDGRVDGDAKGAAETRCDGHLEIDGTVVGVDDTHASLEIARARW
jgi:hypothetical protein